MMFRTENNVPEYYTELSRDFQLLCRLYDLAIQPTRYSINSMETSSDTLRCNENLLPVLGSKVGFFDEVDVLDNSSRRILSAFPHIIRYKGSIKALKYIANLFGRITNSDVSVELNVTDDKHTVTLNFTEELQNSNLFIDLIEYVRPSGFIVEYNVVKPLTTPIDNVVVSDTLTVGGTIRANDIAKHYADVSNVFTEVTEATDLSEEDTNTVGFTQIIGTKE